MTIGNRQSEIDNSSPNIVFILADDLGWRDLSVEGSTYYESPHIDRIANEGMRFTQGYAACQVCSPSRASILTGKYPPRHGITDYIGAPYGETWREVGRHTKLLPPPYEHGLRADEITFVKVLQQAGYRTFFAGKWHLGSDGSDPEDHGFEINKGGFRAGSPPGGYFAPFNNPKLEDHEDGESLPVRLGEETARPPINELPVSRYAQMDYRGSFLLCIEEEERDILGTQVIVDVTDVRLGGLPYPAH